MGDKVRKSASIGAARVPPVCVSVCVFVGLARGCDVTESELVEPPPDGIVIARLTRPGTKPQSFDRRDGVR